MHCGPGIGLGNDQGALFARLLAARDREVLDVVSVGAAAQQPEATLLPQFQHVLAGLGDEVVFAVPKEGEIAVVEPPKEVLGLAQFLDLRGVGYVVQVLGDLKRLVAHLRPVFHSGPDVPEDAFDAFDEPHMRFLAGKADFDSDPRLHMRGVIALGNKV
ncbi:hypothetical protein D9M72_400700 [compost metagenome]